MGKPELLGGRVSRTSKALCVITAGIAFVLGIVVGVLVPLYVLPPLYDSSDAAAAPSSPLPPPPPSSEVPSHTGSTRAAEMLIRGRPVQLLSPPQPAMPHMEQVTVIEIADIDERGDEHLVPVVVVESSTVPATTESTSAAATEASATDSQVFETDHPQPSVNVTGSVSTDEVADDPTSLTDGIFWSESVEAVIPTGFSERAVNEWRDFCKHSALVKVEEGCGRMQNRLITFENGTRSCCRYRQNFDQIQGEIFSFLLSRLLGIQNLAPTALMLVQPSDWQWTAVRAQLNLAQWAADRPVVLTRFLESIEPAYVPQPLRHAERRLHPADLVLRGLKLDAHRSQLVELAQWSDLIVFDYLTANLDRIVNNLYNQQWNPTMMEAPAHNLVRDPTTGLLLFLDNESGLLHGYRLLDKYENYHRTMLDVTCVFRRKTVAMIRQLKRDGNIGELLRRAFRKTHPEMFHYLPTLPERSIRILNERIANVHQVMDRCERTYGSSR